MNYQFPLRPTIDKNDITLTVDPHINKEDNSKGYQPKGIPVVFKEGEQKDVPNTHVSSEFMSDIPFLEAKAITEFQTQKDFRYQHNMLDMITTPKGKLMIYREDESTIAYGYFDNEIQNKQTMNIGGIIMKF